MNQNPCIPSYPGVFQFDIFSVVFSKSMCISALGPSLSSSNSFVILLTHSSFLSCFLVAIFYTKIVRFLLHPVVGIFSCHLLPLVGKISCSCFGMSCFVCIVSPFLDIFLLFLFSPVLSGLFPQVVLPFFSCVAFSFLSLHVPASFLCFTILADFRRFFYLRFQSNFSSWF